MNVTDQEKEGQDLILPEVDSLKQIFALQLKLEERFHPIERRNGVYVPEHGKVDLNAPQDQDYIKSLAMRMILEIGESMECLKNKPWKETHVLTDVDHLYEEVADVFHFFIAKCLAINLDAETLFKYYMKKNKVNHWRRDTKY